MTVWAFYHYRVTEVEKVYDGDTVTLTIDLGFGVLATGMKVRLWGIDAPEVRGPERPAGLAARDALRGLVDGNPVAVRTIRDRTGRYGRWLGHLFVYIGGGWVNANEWLVTAGHATVNTYGDPFNGVWPVLE